MAGGINKVTLIGRLGFDPEAKAMKGDKEFCKLRLATSKKVNGEEITQWHNVVIWSEQNARFVLDYAKKGTLLYLEGEIEYSERQKDDGTMAYYTNIIVPTYTGVVQIMADPPIRGDSQGSSTRQPARSYASEKAPARKPKPEYSEEQRARDRAEFDDEIPF